MGREGRLHLTLNLHTSGLKAAVSGTILKEQPSLVSHQAGPGVSRKVTLCHDSRSTPPASLGPGALQPSEDREWAGIL